MIIVDHFQNKIILKKDGNIKLNIIGPDKKTYKVEFYAIEDHDGSMNGECIYSPSIMYSDWVCTESLDHTSETYPNKIQISISSEMGWFVDVVYDKQKDEFYKINTSRNKEILNNVHDPIILTGAPGGGTSYITKLLKYRGFYGGTDSGNNNVRKNHESISFSTMKYGVCFKDGKFLMWTSEKEIDDLKENLNKKLHFYTTLVKNQLDYKFQTFWGDKPFHSVWGWKDPSASIFLPIWKNIFPSCKLMIIKRNNQKISQNMSDSEGEWFRENNDLLKHFYEPDLSGFSDSDVFRCDFNNVITDIEEMNKMLEWVGLEKLKSKIELIKLLLETGYEGKLFPNKYERG